MRNINQKGRYKCEHCKETFRLAFNLQRHIQIEHKIIVGEYVELPFEYENNTKHEENKQ